VDLYFKNGGEIFSTSLWQKIKTVDGVMDEKYPATGLETSLKEYLGETKLSQALKPCLITSYDILNRRSVFFNSMDAKDDYRDFYLYDIARATSAAPTYFEVANTHSLFGTAYPLIDGGVFANNPAMCALAEATKVKPDVKLSELYLLSVGTGIDKKKQHSYTYDKAKDWGIAGWIMPLIEILMSANSETVDYQLRKIFENTGNSNDYIRFEPELIAADPSMDNATQQNMNALKQDTGQFIADNDTLMDNVVNRLIG
jgi:patatin-like phospholipase/acyl hydrolase